MEIEELYQELILDHYKHPRCAGPVDDACLLVEEFNPVCGDKIRLTLNLSDGVISNLRYDARGCAISVASASMMAEKVVGLTQAEAGSFIHRVVAMLKGEVEVPSDMGDMAALGTVKRYPMRIKCATMSWHALEKALRRV